MAIALSTLPAACQRVNPEQQKAGVTNNDFFSVVLKPKADNYSYYTNEGELRVLDLKIGQKWHTVKTENKKLDNIIAMIREDGEAITDRDYIMLNQFMEIADNYDKKTANNRILEDKELNKLYKKLQKGKLSNDEITKAQTAEIYEIDNWSEGLDRRISYIKIAKNFDGDLLKVRDELVNIGQEMGFKVAEVGLSGVWLEDYSIRRHDGKIYHPVNPAGLFIQSIGTEPTVEYQETIADYDKAMAKSYLEGGNVLNTLNSKGEPAAIIGADAVEITLAAMNMDKNKMNIARAKLQIAEDLGLKPENITYIPQADFHIDMYYRPLQKGVVAVPDFEKGIEILKGMDLPDILNNNKDEYISRLEEVRDRVFLKLKKAENILTEAGYEMVKIPVFAHTSDYGPSTINYMNGICGTSPKGIKFYITNKSEISELDKIAEKYFKDAGVDKVYFVSSLPFLLMYGGIDCLTQEM